MGDFEGLLFILNESPWMRTPLNHTRFACDETKTPRLPERQTSNTKFTDMETKKEKQASNEREKWRKGSGLLVKLVCKRVSQLPYELYDDSMPNKNLLLVYVRMLCGFTNHIHALQLVYSLYFPSCPLFSSNERSSPKLIMHANLKY